MDAVKFPQKQLSDLETFIGLLKSQPALFHHPDLEFFKDFMLSFGAKLPPKETGDSTPKASPKKEAKQDESPVNEEPEIFESDVELDNSGVIDPDNDPPQEMGDPEKELSEADEEKCEEVKHEAIIAFSEGNYERAAELFTEAIKLNPHSALLFAKRANCYIHLNKPNACIRDCDQAIKINPDSATAHKFRGRANRLLGHWEEAAKDLRLACNIDYDDQANEWLKEVTPNAKKLEEHRRKYERLREEKLLKEKQERLRKAKEEHERAAREQKEQPNRSGNRFGGFNPFGGMPGAASAFASAGMPGATASAAAGMPDLAGLLSDPEVLAAFQDPEVAQAFQDISSNPMNYRKYENNPKISTIINKLASKFGGMAGAGAGFPPGGFPNFSDANDTPAPGGDGVSDDLD